VVAAADQVDTRKNGHNLRGRRAPFGGRGVFCQSGRWRSFSPLASSRPRRSTDRPMQYRPLGKTGLNVSALSFGASSLGAVFHEINEAEGVKTVHLAVENGINFIDVSPYYGA